jgi:phospholipid/cholesterol/gamma-HCH transport system permease protein
VTPPEIHDRDSHPGAGPPSIGDGRLSLIDGRASQLDLVVSPFAEPAWYSSAPGVVFQAFGHVSFMLVGSFRALFRRPNEFREIIAQIESIGIKSTPLVIITGSFVGMVMALQFAIGLQKFGGMEYTGRVIALSFSRELAPTLTAVIVGGRIGAGIAAEIGSMAVTEQIDAIRALGADPVKKLVMPRLMAAIITMPILASFSLVLGFSGAMLISATQFGLPAGFFLGSALDSVRFNDFWSGFIKTPFFGAIIALVGCHFGLTTTGGTQGVGRATTQTVVVLSVTILIADFLMTTVFSWIFVS